MKYSILILDKSGRTLRTEFSEFENDATALAQARVEVSDADIVEVWKGNDLLSRLHREKRGS